MLTSQMSTDFSDKSSSVSLFYKRLTQPNYLSFLIGGIVLVAIISLLLRFLGRPQVVLAAGNKTGESYLFSRAFKEVVEANSSIRLDM